MPKEYKYICFKHRHVSKRSGLCPTCRNDLYGVGIAARIPRKIDDAGWKELKEWIILTRNYNPETNEHIGAKSFSERFDQAYAKTIGKKND